VTVHYATHNGTATSPGDYVAKSGTLTFTPGQTTKSIPVTIHGDTNDEPKETFTLKLTSPSGAGITDGVAVGVIANDD
jgi:Calx-beta domain